MKVSCDVIRDLLPLYTDYTGGQCRHGGRPGGGAPGGPVPPCRGLAAEAEYLALPARLEPGGVRLAALQAAVAAEAGPHRRDGGSGDGGGGGGILPDLLLGPPRGGGDVEVSLELQWSGYLTSREDSWGDGSRGELELGNWSGVIHVCSSHFRDRRKWSHRSGGLCHRHVGGAGPGSSAWARSPPAKWLSQ